MAARKASKSSRAARKAQRPKLAVWKFSSCDGCQLTLLDCEDELLEIAEHVEIALFPEATRAVVRGPYDVSLVEGSITTSHDAERIHAVRRASRRLVAIGACATVGGIQALRNFADAETWVASVYAKPGALDVLPTSTPIANHVRVDFELDGCPVSKPQLLAVVAAFLRGGVPVLPEHSVCLECKRRGAVCVTVSAGTPCLGPVTRCGCGALCPSLARGCFGCFGPLRGANVPALGRLFDGLGVPADDRVRTFRGICGAAEAFRRESEIHERPEE